MGDKLITIRVPGNAVGLKYVEEGADGYLQDKDVTLSMYEGVIAAGDVLDMSEYLQSYAEPQRGEMQDE